jgi:hypothetical protein
MMERASQRYYLVLKLYVMCLRWKRIVKTSLMIIIPIGRQVVYEKCVVEKNSFKFYVATSIGTLDK